MLNWQESLPQSTILGATLNWWPYTVYNMKISDTASVHKLWTCVQVLYLSTYTRTASCTPSMHVLPICSTYAHEPTVISLCRLIVVGDKLTRIFIVSRKWRKAEHTTKACLTQENEVAGDKNYVDVWHSLSLPLVTPSDCTESQSALETFRISWTQFSTCTIMLQITLP